MNIFEDVQDAADDYENDTEDDYDGDDDGEEEEQITSSKNKKSDVDTDSVITGEENMDEESYAEALQEAFDELKGKDGKVTVKAFKEWEEVQVMIDEGNINKEFLNEVIANA